MRATAETRADIQYSPFRGKGEEVELTVVPVPIAALNMEGVEWHMVTCKGLGHTEAVEVRDTVVLQVVRAEDAFDLRL